MATKPITTRTLDAQQAAIGRGVALYLWDTEVKGFGARMVLRAVYLGFCRYGLAASDTLKVASLAAWSSRPRASIRHAQGPSTQGQRSRSCLSKEGA